MWWPIRRREITRDKVQRQLDAQDYLLFLRRFGTGALFRFRYGQPGVIAIFDKTRRDYWSPLDLARLFVTWRDLNCTQIALPDQDWFGTVMSMARSSSAVAYDLEGFDDKPAESISGLMLEAELFLYLDRPIAFLARSARATIPRWLPTPLLVLTDGRPQPEVARQFGNILTGKFDHETRRRLEIHRARILAELDYIHKLGERQLKEDGTFGFNPIGALLARDHWSPQIEWHDHAAHERHSSQ